MNDNIQDQIFRMTLTFEGFGEQKFRLYCPRADEEIYRQAQKQIEDKLIRYRAKFPTKTSIDYLVMSAVHIAANCVKYSRLHEQNEVFETMKQLTGEMDEFLNKND